MNCNSWRHLPFAGRFPIGSKDDAGEAIQVIAQQHRHSGIACDPWAGNNRVMGLLCWLECIHWSLSSSLLCCSRLVKLHKHVLRLAGMVLAESAADESAGGVWQDMSLEQDVLLQIFEKLTSSELVKLSGVSTGWRQAMNTQCDPWQELHVNSSQAKSNSFALWVKARGNSTKHLNIDTQAGSSPVPEGVHKRCFLTHMRQLQSYKEGALIKLEGLRQLRPSVQHISAVGQAQSPDASGRIPAIDLRHLTNLQQLELHVQGDFPDVHGSVEVQLAEQSPIEHLTMTPFLAMRSVVLHPGSFHALRSLHLSVITQQEQLNNIMNMLSLEELTIGVNTADNSPLVEDQVDDMDICNVSNLVNLRRLDLTLLCCYLKNAHMLQRLPELQQLSISMTDEVAVLFRPEDGSHFGLPSMLNKVQHVRLEMHSVFDVTDCLEGLQLIATIRSLHVTLQQSSARGPSEVHWAIKDGSVLARALCLQHLQVECTSMLIKLLPPKLTSLHVTARKINVQTDLKVAWSLLEFCDLQARKGVQYF